MDNLDVQMRMPNQPPELYAIGMAKLIGNVSLTWTNMKTAALLIYLLCFTTVANAQNIVMDVYKTVLVHLLTNSPPGGNHYCVAMTVDWKQEMVTPFPHQITAEIIKLAGANAAEHIECAYIRLLKEQEEDPRDPSGKTMRGVESLSTGVHVDLYHLTGIRLLDEDHAEVGYSIYAGPLAARGGSFRVNLKHLTIEKLRGWES